MPGSACLSANYSGKDLASQLTWIWQAGAHAKSGFPHRFRNNYKLAGFSQTTRTLSTKNLT